MEVQLDVQRLIQEAIRLHQSGEFNAAEALYRAVLLDNPKHANALNLYGCMCDAVGRVEEGIALVRRAVLEQPAGYPYFYNLANMLVKIGNLAEAVEHYQTAIRLKPDYAVAHNNLGLVFNKLGNGTKAMECFRAAIAIQPNYPDPYFNLALELKASGVLDEAIVAYKRAIQLRPDFTDAHFNLGNAYSIDNQLSLAVDAYQHALRLRPEKSPIYTNFGATLMKMGCVQEAIDCYREALRLDPDDVLNHSNLILAASYVSSDPEVMHKECVQWEEVHGASLRNAWKVHANGSEPDRKLRVGYVSADFREHAAAYWIEPLLAGHYAERNVFLTCYSNSPVSDATTERLRNCADDWVDCSLMGDGALAERIREDKIDILVDLSGHTEGNRLLMFARKPAPVQVSWFGFPVSTGLRAIDYRLTDTVLDPAGVNDGFYSEKLARLEHFYAVFRPDPRTPAIGAGPAEKNGFVTFASINAYTKVTRSMMSLWCEIMRAEPNARLLLQGAGLDGDEMAGEVRAIFANNGVSADRLILRGWTDLAGYLSLGNEVDIALDPYPFNGGVTTCHSLWMGLPVVTLSGRSAASRVGRSILSRMGLMDLVADTPIGYRDIALSLASDAKRLALLRSSMRDRMAEAGLLDGNRLALEVEASYRIMWKQWCAEQQKCL